MSAIHPKEGGIEVFAGYLLLAKRTVQGDQTRNNSSGLYYKNILTIVSDDRKWSLYYKCSLTPSLSIRKDCFQNKSKFITKDQFTEHMNITTSN
jgi:hypothetical protein